MDAAHAHHLQQASFDLLQQAYSSYLDALKQPCAEQGRRAVGEVMSQASTAGLHGAAAMHLITSNKQRINWQDMSPDQFNSFYRFSFLLCREPGRRNLQAPVALQLWRHVLGGRFRLLERWCDFVRDTNRTIITEDTWRQVLDFSRAVHEDLGNYDPSGAWPVLLDEFVEHLRQQHLGSRAVAMEAEPMNVSNPWANRQCMAISPRSGSKRKQLDLQEVMDQLQFMPPLAAEEPPGAPSSSTGGSTSSSDAQRTMVHAKRVRLGISTKPPTGSPVKPPALPLLPAGNRALDHLQSSFGGLAAPPGAAGSPSSSLVAAGGAPGGPGAGGSPMSSSPRGGRVMHSSWRGSQGVGALLGPHRMGQQAGTGEAGRGDPRGDSLHALMQSTVVEALGFK